MLGIIPEIILSIGLGVGLAAACGFRIFLPLFAASLLSYLGSDVIPLGESFAWLGTLPTVITFGAATLLEIGAYYIPWFDNALDSIAIPLATLAGSIVAMSVIGDVEPWIKWPLGIIAGGGTAGIIKSGAAATRLTSSVTTGGIANPVFSTVETGGSILMTILSLFIPIIAILMVMGVIYLASKRVIKRLLNGKTDASSEIDVNT